ncbi:MAG: heavy metal translocating P-type ATPase [Sphingobacteriales bacterium]|jgi:Cu+-exporting ATPase
MQQQPCYHCGETCDASIKIEEKAFCCEGCKQVYLLLSETDMCNYYDLDKTPGITAKGRFTDNRYAYLDNEEVQSKLLRFRDGKQAHVQFYLPTMHCASCIWLLENLHRINPAVIHSQTNFQRKEILVIFDVQKTSLRKIVELLAFVGYEPYITLNDGEKKKDKKINRSHIFKIGVAGFAFSNIMMLSFPDYFAGGHIGDTQLRNTFTYVSLLLSLPVLFFSASEFFISGWKGLRQGWLNIDAPIALAVLMAFGRSVYEILTHTGPGYLDSMSGIVFFMLVGRWFQNRTYDAFSFDRDYKSYFPLGVTRVKDNQEVNVPVINLQKGDVILVRNEEMVPADGILLKGRGSIDYSFVSGETTPVDKNKGELLYAGGKQMGTTITVEVVTPVSQSYITQLWNNDVFNSKKNKSESFVHPWSRYFTYTLFALAFFSALYWYQVDSTKILPAITSVLIVACPCSLLLSATFTYGNMLGIYGRKKLYLKNANVIEALGKVDTIVLDKTGTLTHHHAADIRFEGDLLSAEEKSMVQAVAAQSTHPLSKMISRSLMADQQEGLSLEAFQELSGKGLEATVNHRQVRIGSSSFIREDGSLELAEPGVHIRFDDEVKGRFVINNMYRDGIAEMASQLKAAGYDVHLLSGDNDTERKNLAALFGEDLHVLFRQSPQDKLEYIKKLQLQGKNVMMLGDGLNDAGALRQAQVGIAVTDATNLFSPASDGILDGSQVGQLAQMLRYAKTGKRIVTVSFILSILYNIVGLSFATQAKLSPLIAAILMPASSISIVVLVSVYARITARTIRN